MVIVSNAVVNGVEYNEKFRKEKKCGKNGGKKKFSEEQKKSSAKSYIIWSPHMIVEL